jgi:hypothetical protein
MHSRAGSLLSASASLHSHTIPRPSTPTARTPLNTTVWLAPATHLQSRWSWASSTGRSSFVTKARNLCDSSFFSLFHALSGAVISVLEICLYHMFLRGKFSYCNEQIFSASLQIFTGFSWFHAVLTSSLTETCKTELNRQYPTPLHTQSPHNHMNLFGVGFTRRLRTPHWSNRLLTSIPCSTQNWMSCMKLGFALHCITRG